MQNILYTNSKLEVRKSPIHGYGVFAKENIKKGEILEKCHYIQFKNKIDDNFLEYAFSWPKRDRHDIKGKYKYATIPFGYACIYNSSVDVNTNNADWETDITNNLFIFTAVKDIPANTEILTYYGNAYWHKRNNNIK